LLQCVKTRLALSGHANGAEQVCFRGQSERPPKMV
jgi:hypothetical protein